MVVLCVAVAAGSGLGVLEGRAACLVVVVGVEGSDVGVVGGSGVLVVTSWWWWWRTSAPSLCV